MLNATDGYNWSIKQGIKICTFMPGLKDCFLKNDGMFYGVNIKKGLAGFKFFKTTMALKSKSTRDQLEELRRTGY